MVVFQMTMTLCSFSSSTVAVRYLLRHADVSKTHGLELQPVICVVLPTGTAELATGPDLHAAVGSCLGALWTGFVLRTITPTLGFPNPFAEVRTARLCPQAKVVTPAKHSEVWESLLEKVATDEYQVRVIE